MDFEFERLRQELVREIEEKLNVEIAAARPVRVKILPRDEAFQIPDLIRTKINLLPEGISESGPSRSKGWIAGRRRHPRGQHPRGRQNSRGRVREQRKINKRIRLEIGD